MAAEIRVPRLGWSMEEGTFVRWLKRHGDSVKVGEPLYELEGEKAIQEVESIDAGILHIPEAAPGPGSTIPVGGLLGYVLGAGESPPLDTSPENSNGEKLTSCTLKDAVPSENRFFSTSASSVTRITPRAKRLARQRSLDWTNIRGTGRDGRIREADIQSALMSRVVADCNSFLADQNAETKRVVLSGRRLAIANRMMLSRQKTVPVTLTTQADVSRLVEKRSLWKKLVGTENAPSYSDCFAYLAARTLVGFPNVASIWESDEVLRVPTSNSISVGIAVDTPDGLLVPVIRGASGIEFSEFVRKSKQAIVRCRLGKTTPEELSGGFFTVTSLGNYGIDAFTPIINYPEVAILGLGAIRRTYAILDADAIEIRYKMILSLTFDHRAIDGAPVAEFLRVLVKSIEEFAFEIPVFG